MECLGCCFGLVFRGLIDIAVKSKCVYVGKASPTGSGCFRCLLILSGCVELLIVLC